MIELTALSRWYGQVIGVNDVDARIEPGITALLGMNGAGKTTLIRLITGQLKPTTGEVRVGGLEPFANPEVYRILGYCPDIDNFYESMSGRQYVTYLAQLAGFPKPEAKRRADEMIEWVGMSDRADRRIACYSKGMRQRIKLAQAMLNDPKIVLLDEPLNGLDPVGRRQFMDLLARLADQGKTIVVSSHILFEVEQMTRSILLLHRGRLLASGDVRVIRELIDKHPHRIHIVTPRPRELAQQVAGLPFVLSIRYSPGGRGLEVQTREPDRFYAHLQSLGSRSSLGIESLSSPDNNLESVFRYLVEA
ncbi:MAG: ABC transporter ATP-binding protein [Fimbriimonadaceae bacterium]